MSRESVWALGEFPTCQVPLSERRELGRLRTVREAPAAMRLDACWEWPYGDRMSRRRRIFKGRQKEGTQAVFQIGYKLIASFRIKLHVETLSKPAASTKHPLRPLNK